MKPLPPLLALALSLGGLPAFAQHDSSNFAGGFQVLDGKTFAERFQLHGEYFVVDQTGKRFVSLTSETRDWKADTKTGQIELFWTISARGFKSSALHSIWKIKPDSSIDVVTQQCDEIRGLKPSKCHKILREEKTSLENFAPITWVTDTTAEARLVARFTPVVEDARERLITSRMIIGGDRNSFEVFDNQGHVWGEATRFGGVLSGLKSWRGGVVFSLYPFTNAKEIGWASGRALELDLTDELHLTVRNDREVIPGETRVKVYGRYLPKLKTKGNRTYQSFGVEEEKDLDPDFK